MQFDQSHLWGALATAIPALIAVVRSRADATKSKREANVVRTEAEAQQTAAFVKAYEHSRADLEQARAFVEAAYKHLDNEREARKKEHEDCAKAISKLQTQLLAQHREMTDLRDAVFSATSRPDSNFRDHTMLYSTVKENTEPPARRDHTGPFRTERDDAITLVERPSLKPKRE